MSSLPVRWFQSVCLKIQVIIVIFKGTTTYKSISHTVQYLSDIPPHPTVSVLPLTFPTSHASIIDRFREHLRSLNLVDPGKRKTVAMIDSITANPGVYMPWKEMVRICREEGVWSVVDAAHAIGQELDIELGKADPDFWVSVWLFISSVISTRFLYTPLFFFCRIVINGCMQNGRVQCSTCLKGQLCRSCYGSQSDILDGGKEPTHYQIDHPHVPYVQLSVRWDATSTALVSVRMFVVSFPNPQSLDIYR
jgi:hypothetical protein